MPSDFQLTKSQLFFLLNGPSPIDDTKVVKTSKSKAQPGLKNVKNTPVTLHKRKIKMPRTVRVSVLKQKSKKVTFDENVTVHDNISPSTSVIENPDKQANYSDVQSHCAISNGNKISAKQFHSMQMADPTIVAAVDNKDKNVSLNNGIFYKLVNGEKRIFLPEVLLTPLIILNHFVAPGIHKTKQQISRDILAVYCVSKNKLNQAISEQIQNCHICQIFSDGKQHLKILQLPRHSTTRLSWSVDLITDLSLSDNGFKILLIAVDDFSNYILAVPLRTTTAQELIQAIKNHIISPFGIPKFIRSDEQPGIYNSKEFFKFFHDLGIELQATAVASPFSNGRAETTIKIFKHAARKYFFQQNCIKKWDEHVSIITAALNSSINSYGFAPEEIMFGHRLENRYALVDLPSTHDRVQPNTEQAIEAFLERIIAIRQKYDANKLRKHQANATFKNKHAKEKCFEVGDLVLHRQLQVSTGTASKYRPQLTGPYVIQAIDGITATCKHIETGRIIKAHFLNLAPYRYDEGKIYPPKAVLDEPLGQK